MSARVVTREVFVLPAALRTLVNLPARWDEAEHTLDAIAEAIRAEVDAEIIETLRNFQGGAK